MYLLAKKKGIFIYLTSNVKKKRKIQQLEAQDILECVTNEPKPKRKLPVIVPKRNNIRLCAEIRCANKVVIRLRHPSPTVDDILISVQGSTSFSKLGLKSGFYQLDTSLAFRSITFQIKKRKNTLQETYF